MSPPAEKETLNTEENYSIWSSIQNAQAQKLHHMLEMHCIGKNREEWSHFTEHIQPFVNYVITVHLG